MLKRVIILAAVFAAGCSGEPASSAGSHTTSKLDSQSAGAAQPSFCDYATELRDLPADPCDFTGVCKVQVAIYCDDPQAANRKKYDCECVKGAYSCTATEIGLSIDPTCPRP